MDDLKAKFPELGPVIDDYIAHLDQIPNAKYTQLMIEAAITGTGEAGAAAGRWIYGRASGGPVAAGMPYIVGEKGPELFVPGRSGTIIPNGGSGGGGGATTINLILDGTVVGQAVIDDINRRATRGPGPLLAAATVM